MRRGQKTKKAPPKPVVQETRQTTSPMVVVSAASAWNSTTTPRLTELLCSQQQAWRVWVYMADVKQWWDYSSSYRKANARACLAPTKGTLVHLVVMYGEDNNNNQNNNDNNNSAANNPNDAVHQAALRLGESLHIATVAFMPQEGTTGDAVTQQRSDAFQEALLHNEQALLNLSSTEQSQRQACLWDLHKAWDTPRPDLECCEATLLEIEKWPVRAFGWNGARVRTLYQTMLLATVPPEQDKQEDKNETKDDDDENKNDPNNNNGSKKAHRQAVFRMQGLRKRLEGTMATLLQDEHGKRVTNYVLTTTISANKQNEGKQSNKDDPGLVFGRTLAVAKACASPHADAIVVGKGTATLDPIQYATSLECSIALDLLQTKSPVLSQGTNAKGLTIPRGNPMITIRLLPALFRTGTQDVGAPVDSVLGSGRIWDEHMALKASILYLFDGQSTWLWKMALAVVETALPKTWAYLFNCEAPDETFLRALFHPDVVDTGRLGWNQESRQSQLLPPYWRKMASIYSLARFLRSLPKPILDKTQTESVQSALASTMKISPSQAVAIATGIRTKDNFGMEDCVAVLGISDAHDTPMKKNAKKPPPVAGDYEILGMLALFLHRDHQSFHDNTTGKVSEPPPMADCTNQVLVDCAMFCGAIRWLPEEESWEDGLWTCLPCLHRWQRRDKREAFQTRKLMHPMKMMPFTRDEYYDPTEWDNIMKATNGKINRLGIDFYWGECSNGKCRRVSPTVPRSGACAETDGVPLRDFPETITLVDDTQLSLRATLGDIGALGPNSSVTSSSLEKFFDSEEKLTMLPGRLRRRVRNCIDKSRYILPRCVLCEECSIPTDAIDEYCPYCATGFEPVFACVHYSCPMCDTQFCKACLGIEGTHFEDVYDSESHICMKLLANAYMFQNKGECNQCGKERPWPESHRLVSAGPEISRIAATMKGDGMSLEAAVALQADNLERFTSRYEEGVEIFKTCSHTKGLGPDFCHCGENVDADGYEEADYY